MLFGISITFAVLVLILFLVISFFAMLYFRGHRHAYRVTRYRVLLIVYFAKNTRSYLKRFLRIVEDDFRIKRRKERNQARKVKKPP